MSTLGIAGGGQLGRMLAVAARDLGVKTVTLDSSALAPAAAVSDAHHVGSYSDHDAIMALSRECDVMTYEIESVNDTALTELAAQGFPVHPTPATLSIIKDKLKQKTHLREKGIAVADFMEVSEVSSAEKAGELFGYPFILKARSGGFDGRGNARIDARNDIAPALSRLFGEGSINAYAENFVPFDKELAVIAARTVGGEIAVYPLVETIHKNHICHMVLAPASVEPHIASLAHDLAQKVLQTFDGAGVFAIELFLVGESVVVNEIAPRVHNSGHFTIEGCETSQFAQHVRAVMGMPLGSTAMKVPAAVMINILGDRDGTAQLQGVLEAEAVPGVKVHFYGKLETRRERKMGHLTACADSLEEAKRNAEHARNLLSL